MPNTSQSMIMRSGRSPKAAKGCNQHIPLHPACPLALQGHCPLVAKDHESITIFIFVQLMVLGIEMTSEKVQRGQHALYFCSAHLASAARAARGCMIVARGRPQNCSQHVSCFLKKASSLSSHFLKRVIGRRRQREDSFLLWMDG